MAPSASLTEVSVGTSARFSERRSPARARWAAQGQRDSNAHLPDPKGRACPHRVTAESSRKKTNKNAELRKDGERRDVHVSQAVTPRLGFVVNGKPQSARLSDERSLGPVCAEDGGRRGGPCRPTRGLPPPFLLFLNYI